MSATRKGQSSSTSKATSLDELAEFWETHSLDDYWDQTRPADIEVKAIRRRRVTLDPDVFARIEVQAHRRGLTPETLINTWLAEKLAGVSQ
jgi:hypothetical protein